MFHNPRISRIGPAWLRVEFFNLGNRRLQLLFAEIVFLDKLFVVLLGKMLKGFLQDGNGRFNSGAGFLAFQLNNKAFLQATPGGSSSCTMASTFFTVASSTKIFWVKARSSMISLTGLRR